MSDYTVITKIKYKKEKPLTTNANWSIDLYAECPYCGNHCTDLQGQLNAEDIPPVGESADELEIECSCDGCGALFLINTIET